MFNGLTRHVEYHRPSSVNARLAEEAGHRVVGDGGDGDARVHGAEGDKDTLIHTFYSFIIHADTDVSKSENIGPRRIII